MQLGPRVQLGPSCNAIKSLSACWDTAQGRATPPMPHSSPGRSLRSSSRSGYAPGRGAMHAQGLTQGDPPFLAGISLRADLGGFCIDVQSEAAPPVASDQLPSASPNAAGQPAGSITSPAAGVPSAFAEPSQQEAEAAGTCGAAAVEAGMRRLVAVGSTDVTLLPQPPNDSRTVEFEGACA